jgi:TolB-like protein
MRRHIPLVIALAFHVSGFAAPPRLPRIAILDLTTTSVQVGRGDLAALSSRLETEFQKTEKFQVLERRNMSAILQEQGFQQSGACGSDCQVQVGQILGVERIVVGEVTKVDKILTLNLKMIDVGTGANLRSHALDIKGGMDALLRGGAWEMAQIFSGKKVPTSDRSVLTTEKQHVWPWVVAGTVVVAGATVAVVYLLNQDNSSSTSQKKTVDAVVE